MSSSHSLLPNSHSSHASASTASSAESLSASLSASSSVSSAVSLSAAPSVVKAMQQAQAWVRAFWGEDRAGSGNVHLGGAELRWRQHFRHTRKSHTMEAAQVWAMGDPQTSAVRFFSVLYHRGLLGEDGLLLPHIRLISVGDHFDYQPHAGESIDDVADSGLLIATWLAAHDPSQTVMLLGNHDTARVMELAYETDDGFYQARILGERIAALEKELEKEGEKESEKDPNKHAYQKRELESLRNVFALHHPHIPTPQVASRDYSAFRSIQRLALQTWLSLGRVKLAYAAPCSFILSSLSSLGEGEYANKNTRALVIHAGLTEQDIQMLWQLCVGDQCMIPSDPDAYAPANSAERLASVLNGYLASRVRDVIHDWRAGRMRHLDLRPLHVHGTALLEGGGLLYHRPAHPTRKNIKDVGWEFYPQAPRRYDPRILPVDLVQICGHTGHRKLRDELAEWVTPAAHALDLGGMRTLYANGDDVVYEGAIHPPKAGYGTLYLIDADINRVDPATYPLLRLV